MSVVRGEGTAYPSGAPELTPQKSTSIRSKYTKVIPPVKTIVEMLNSQKNIYIKNTTLLCYVQPHVLVEFMLLK
jgi:hypothetical protein